MMLHRGHSHRIDREFYCPQHTIGSTCWWYTLTALCCQAYTCFQQNCINVQWLLSQSWLDSICMDSRHTIIIIITKQTQNLKNAKLILYNNVPFILECFHNEQHAQWRKKKTLQKYQTRKSTEDQKPKCISFFFLLRLASSNCLHNYFCTNSSFFRLSSAPAHHFFTWSLPSWFKLLTEELWLHLHLHFFTHTHVYKSLSNKTIHYSRLLN